MTELSPAARAVLEAVTWKKYDVPPEGLPAFAQEMAPLLATALRAAADQVVPEMRLEDVPGRFVNGCCHSQGQRIRSDLLAIAAELEGGNV